MAGLSIRDHKTRHQNSGDDEISVAGLSGTLADDQHVIDSEALAAAEAGAVSVATADKLVKRDAQGQAAFAAPAAAGDVLIKGTRVTIAELPALIDEKIWVGTGGNVEERAVYTDAKALAAAIAGGLLGVQVKLKAETKNLEDSSGDIEYTGYGFTPSGLIIIGHRDNYWGSIGISNPARSSQCFYQNAAVNDIAIENTIAHLCTTNATTYQDAVVASYDADGFTLTWAKNGVLSGTANLIVIAFK